MKKYRYYACDFETTVYVGQDFTEVWLSGACELFTEEPHVFFNLKDLFYFFISLKCNIVAYFHNLKFDGSFWLPFLLECGYEQAIMNVGSSPFDLKWIQTKNMKNNSFKYCISDKGQFYNIIIKINNKFIEIRDSVKLLPYSLRDIAKFFETKHKKLEMEYEGFRYAGCEVKPNEIKYFHNDLFVLKEGLEVMFNDGYNRLTIGSCCLHEFKEIFKSNKFELDYKEVFPDLKEYPLEMSKYGSDNADSYIRKSYKGGWSYLVKGKENKVFTKGLTFDVNSLYPSMMHSDSKNRYPVGLPVFWSGNYIPEKAIDNYYFIRVKTKFEIKKGFLPTIQIKGNPLYKSTEWLTTSDIYDKKEKIYVREYVANGEKKSTDVILTLTCTDYRLLKKHYNLFDFEILDGCWFYTLIGLFDDYINKFMEIKINSKGAKKNEAKLFLNALYGKIGSSDNSSFKYAIMKEDGVLGFINIAEHDKNVGYIPIGSAITSYARNFTISHAQINYYGVNEPGFIYADTDSIHCDLKKKDVIGIEIDDKNLCKWKLESEWEEAIFLRQKSYIEKDRKEGYKITCAGMTKKCKGLIMSLLNKKISNLLSDSLDLSEDEIIKKLNEEEYNYLFDDNGNFREFKISDFKVGLNVPSKLIPKRIKGGIILTNTTFKIR